MYIPASGNLKQAIDLTKTALGLPQDGAFVIGYTDHNEGQRPRKAVPKIKLKIGLLSTPSPLARGGRRNSCFYTNSRGAP